MHSVHSIPHPGLPGPRPVPLLGLNGSMLRLLADPVRFLLDLSTRYGDLAAVSGGDAAVVCAFGAEHNRTILSDAQHFQNLADPPMAAPPASAAQRFSRNITNLNGDEHKRLRRRMMPLFARSAVERYRDAVAAEIERRLERFRPGATIDAAAVSMELALAVMMRCLFGLDLEGDGAELGDLGAEALERLSDPLAVLVPIRFPGAPLTRSLKAWERLETCMRGLLARRRERGGESKDVLSLLIQAYEAEESGPEADDELIAQAELFFLAGYETTAFSVAATLFLLSQHPEQLAWLGEELAGTLRGRLPTIEELGALPRLDAVVKESMRILPAVPYLFFRRATDPFTIAGHQLPVGTVICLSPLVTHRAPDVYPDPAIFRPQRWENLSPGTYAYLPFGAGPRTCLGGAFATQSVRLILAALLQRAWPALRSEANVSRKVRGITMGFRHGLPMQLVAPGDVPPRRRVRGDIHDLVQLPI